MKLFELTEQAAALAALLEADEITEEELEVALEDIGADEKLKSYIQLQKQLEVEIEAHKKEKARHEGRIEALQSRVDWLKRGQVDFMRGAGLKKAKAGTWSLSLRETPKAAIDDEAALPAQFVTEIPATTKPDKRAILAALKAGEAVSGAHMESTFSVTVR